MTRTNRSGFTIIEVVITIAIGAAVMALVLNAVAGARRSQRNNARAADVNQVAAGVNQFIASRNRLPATWTEISTIIDAGDKFGHYEATSINPQFSWNTSHPSADGAFTVVGGTPGLPASVTVSATCNPVSTPNTQTGCTAAGGNWQLATTTVAAPLTTAGSIGSSEAAAADKVIVFQQAGCTTTSQIEQGGIREMAIVYKLEGQDAIVCLEV